MPHPSSDPVAQLYQGVQLTRPLLRHITAAVEAELAGTGVSVGMRAVLEALSEADTATLPDLTARLGLKRQFIHRMLAEALNIDMAEALPHPRRRNGHTYRLTRRGRATIERIRARENARLAEFLGRISADDVAPFLRVQAALNHFFLQMANGDPAAPAQESQAP